MIQPNAERRDDLRQHDKEVEDAHVDAGLLCRQAIPPARSTASTACLPRQFQRPTIESSSRFLS